MKSAEHIVLLVPGFADGEPDESCIPPLQVMLRAFLVSKPDCRFSIIAFQYPYRNDIFNWHGITVYPCDGSNRKGFYRFITWRRAKRMFRKIHTAHPVTMIHSFWLTECAKTGQELSLQYGIPHLNTLMGQDALPENKYLSSFRERRFPVVALCKRHSEIFRQYTGRPADHIVRFGTEAIENHFPPKETDILVACWLHPLKRVEMALRITDELKKDFPEIRTVIHGDGEELQKLKSLSERMGLSLNVRFTGRISRKETLELMKRSRVLLHPSSFEGFGYVFAEAMQLQLPVVSFPVGFAEASATWRVVETEGEAKEAVKTFLQHPPADGFIPVPVTETVEAYAALYREISARTKPQI